MIFSTVVGSGTATLYRTYRAAGFDPARMPIASLTTSEAEVAEMGAEAAEGHITAAPFFETLSSPAARRFVASFKEKYGADAPVTAGAEACVFSASSGDAGCRANADPTIRSRCWSNCAMPNSTRRKGGSGSIRKTITPTSGRGSRASISIGRFQTVWNPGVRIKPDPYCVVQSLDDWSVDDLPAASSTKHLATESRKWRSKFFVILRGLRVHVVHPPDNERIKLVEHLRRIGCMVETQWPVPECWAEGADVVLLALSTMCAAKFSDC